MSQLVLRNRQRIRRVNLPLFRRIVRSLLDDLVVCESCELCVHLVSISEITHLNETFLRHAGSTDVITFNHTATAVGTRLSQRQVKSEPPHVGCCGQMHGEIFICVEEAICQARRFRTSWQSELVRYLVHGVLHLCGFDDQRPASRREMKREENRLLRELAGCWPLAKLAN